MYDNEDSVCGIIYNNVPYYFRKNLQGDIIEIVDKDAKRVARYSYDAWGACTVVSGSNIIAYRNPFRYRGYYYDIENKLYYLNSRYYDPAVGRFINADAIKVTLISNRILLSNLYTYCANNPVMDRDDTGRWGLITSMAIGALFGIAVQFFMDIFNCLVKELKIIKENFSGWWDYVCAAASGAAAATGIGKMASVLWSILCSTINYIGNVVINGSRIKVLDLLVNSVIAGICGYIGGSGANLTRVSGVVNTSKAVLRTAVSPRKIAMYTSKIRNAIVSTVINALRYMIASFTNWLGWNIRSTVKGWL